MTTTTGAVASIAEHLSTPSSLQRIPVLKQRIAKERASLQSTLSDQAREQVDSVKHGLQALKDARQNVERVKESIKDISRAMNDPRAEIRGFDKLVHVSTVHRRFSTVLDTVTALKEMVDRLTLLEQLLAQDRADPLGPSPNLLTVHYHLTELETFRNETLAQARRAATSPTSMRTLEHYFDKMGSVLEAFEAHYFRLCRELLEITRNGHASIAVRIAKIAQVEQQRDERAIAIKMVKKASKDIASRFKSIQAEARTIKHYRSKVVEEIREGCVNAVERSFKRANEDGVRWMEELDWLFDDLDLIEKDLVPRFPSDWNIRTVYIKGYHKALYDFLKLYVASTPEPGALLRLAQFTKDYRSTMMKSFGVPQEYLEPPLLDGQESDLLENYYRLIVDKMQEWTDNLMKTEIADFVARTDPPEMDAEGHYALQGAVILFQMLNQQVDLALDSNQGAILLRVVQESNKTMRKVQAQWLATIDAELKRQVDKPEESPGGLAEYVMALANDQLKSADFTEALNARLGPLVSAKYSGPIADALNDAVDGFLDVAKRCVAVLIDLVFHDLKPATKALFQTQWYVATPETGGDPITLIVETMRDYMVEDYRVRLNASLFELLVEDIIDTFLITYLVAIRKAKSIKMPAAVDKMKRDTDIAFEFFAQFKPAKELATYFEVLDSVRTLMSASKMMVFLDYWPFRKKFGPNIAYVEAIMRARDDLDRSSTNEIIESIKRKVSTDTTTVDDPDQPSIFQRLPAK